MIFVLRRELGWSRFVDFVDVAVELVDKLLDVLICGFECESKWKYIFSLDETGCSGEKVEVCEVNRILLPLYCGVNGGPNDVSLDFLGKGII